MAAENIKRAFLNKTKASLKHDRTDGNAYYYRDNKIAWRDENNNLWISSCGWNTITTKERLTSLGVSLVQKKGEWILKGKYFWDGSPINYDELGKEIKTEELHKKSLALNIEHET